MDLVLSGLYLKDGNGRFSTILGAPGYPGGSMLLFSISDYECVRAYPAWLFEEAP